jgi:hypothetical protein
MLRKYNDDDDIDGFLSPFQDGRINYDEFAAMMRKGGGK